MRRPLPGARAAKWWRIAQRLPTQVAAGICRGACCDSDLHVALSGAARWGLVFAAGRMSLSGSQRPNLQWSRCYAVVQWAGPRLGVVTIPFSESVHIFVTPSGVSAGMLGVWRWEYRLGSLSHV